MTGRRTFLMGGLGSAAVLAAGGGLVAHQSYPIAAWQRAVAETWQPVNTSIPSGQAQLLELVRVACLAANSHNTQPWKFRLGENLISIVPDFARGTPVVDPDNHHLFASMGCALENIVQAAPVLGLAPHVQLPTDFRDGINVQLETVPALANPLAAMIHLRQSSRTGFDGKPLSPADLDALTAAAAGGKTFLSLLTSPDDITGFAKLIADATMAQMQDSSYVAELKHGIRFSYGQALATRDGLFSLCSGSPALPGPIGRLLFSFVATAASESQRYHDQVRASSGIAIFSSDEDNAMHWVEAGRSYQRFALEATRLGLKHSFVNQPVEVKAFNAELLRMTGRSQGRADLVVRFGYGPLMPRSLRRPVETVTVFT